MIFTKDDVIKDSCHDNFEEKLLILRTEGTLNEGYRNAKYQLWACRGGFGANPSNMGRKIFGTFVADFDSGMVCTRENVLGIAKPETVETWKKLFPDLADNVEEVFAKE